MTLEERIDRIERCIVDLAAIGRPSGSKTLHELSSDVRCYRDAAEESPSSSEAEKAVDLSLMAWWVCIDISCQGHAVAVLHDRERGGRCRNCNAHLKRVHIFHCQNKACIVPGWDPTPPYGDICGGCGKTGYPQVSGFTGEPACVNGNCKEYKLATSWWPLEYECACSSCGQACLLGHGIGYGPSGWRTKPVAAHCEIDPEKERRADEIRKHNRVTSGS